MDDILTFIDYMEMPLPKLVNHPEFDVEAMRTVSRISQMTTEEIVNLMEERMIEDKLEHDERLRLECLALAHAGQSRTVSTEGVIHIAKKFEDYIKNGSNDNGK